MRRPSAWTALWSGALATILLGGAPFCISPSHAQADATWLNVGLPLDRDGHSAVYDATRDRMIVFGGIANTRRNDVWALPLSSTTAWHQLNVVGTMPSPRSSHASVYDPVNDRMVVFGGFDTGYRNDVWTLSLASVPTWQQLIPAGTPPTPRAGHTSVYDPVRQRMIVIGGGANGTDNNEVWALTLSGAPAWNQLAVQGNIPNPRSQHSAIYDPDGDRVLVFGGIDAVTGVTREVWELSLAGTPTWNLLVTSGPPPLARLQHDAVHDPIRRRMLVFGGMGAVGGDSFDDVWELTLGATPTWSLLFPTGFAYPPRHGHSMIYDSAHDRMIAFGGTVQEDVEFKTNEVMALTLAPLAWTRPVNETRPFPREGHSAVIDVPRHRMVAFGGTASTGAAFNEAWTLDLEEALGWTLLAPSGTPPAGRFEHAAIYDPVGQRMIVFGGWNGGGVNFGGVPQLSLSGSPAWSTIAATGVPPTPRHGHTAVYDAARNRMIVFGGISGATVFNDAWALSLGATPTWTLLTPTGTPPAGRFWHTAIYDAPRDRMIVGRGATIGGANFDDLWELTLSGTPTWNPIAATGVPPISRQRQSAVYDPYRDRMIVFGGYYFDGNPHRVNTSHALDLSGSLLWAPLATGGDLPPEIDAHTAVFDGPRDRMVAFGGHSQNGGQNNAAWVLAFSHTTDVPVINERRIGVEVRAYPVPSRGGVTFEIRSPRTAGATVVVSDLAGRVVRRLAATESEATRLRWDGRTGTGARAAAGVYFYRVQCAAGQASGRVIKIE
jgi:Galactose oxidase, central domain/FlgD Ig-like domain/Kelch motif